MAVVVFGVILLIVVLNVIAMEFTPVRKAPGYKRTTPEVVAKEVMVDSLTDAKNKPDVKAFFPNREHYKKSYASSIKQPTDKIGFNMKNTHPFSFLGGEELAQMGATWFVAYCYHRHIDYGYTAWKRVKTASMRRTVYERNEKYHAYWLRQVLSMDDARLNTNRMKINARDTKRMARELLSRASFSPLSI